MARCDNCPSTGPRGENCYYDVFQQFEYEELQRDLLTAIKDFYLRDLDLISIGANEVCITGHIFHYFAMHFTEKYKDYNIDPEYNRNGFGAKYFCRDSYAKPDLIIHKRKCNKHNLLYIEFKVGTKRHDFRDKLKISRFVSNEFGEENQKKVMPYRYRYGVSIILTRCYVRMLWYRNGCLEPFVENTFSTKTWELTK